jgi:hypothetical protein
MPKTAGSSFLQALETQFGEGLRKDYSDMARIQQYLAGNLSPQEVIGHGIVELETSPPPTCIHGHFLPAKFLTCMGICEMKFITWLRDPVERLFSHYFYFMRSYNPRTAGPLFRKIVEENWSLETFCFSEQYRNFYSKYLWNFPYERFDFVGLTEFYEDDLRHFSERFLKTEVKAFRLNCAVESKITGYQVDSSFRRDVESFHSVDVALYNRALQEREQRV